MPRRDAPDWEEPDEEYEEDWDDDESSTVPCPSCGRPVYEDAEQCPHCGEYIVPGMNSNVLASRPKWFQILAILGIIAVILSFIFLY